MTYLRGKKRKPAKGKAIQFFNDCDKYLKTTRKEEKTLGIFSPGQMLLRITPLKLWPQSMIKPGTSPTYEDGFLLYFMLENEGIEKNPAYLKYKSSGLVLHEILMCENPVMRAFLKEIPRPENGLELGRVVMDLLVQIYSYEIMPLLGCEIINEEGPMEFSA